MSAWDADKLEQILTKRQAHLLWTLEVSKYRTTKKGNKSDIYLLRCKLSEVGRSISNADKLNIAEMLGSQQVKRH